MTSRSLKLSLCLSAFAAALSACSHEPVREPQQPPPVVYVEAPPAPRAVSVTPAPTPMPAPIQEAQNVIPPLPPASKVERAPHGPPPGFLVLKCKSLDSQIDFIAGTENNGVTFHGVRDVRDPSLQVEGGAITVPARVPGVSVNYVANSVRVLIVPEAHDRYLLVWNDRGMRSDGSVAGDAFPFAGASGREDTPFVKHIETKCTQANQPD